MPSKFDQKLKNYLTIYKIPIGPDQLDPTVFYYSEVETQHKLLPAIHAQITRDLQNLVGGQEHRIDNYYLVGSATEPGNTNRTGELKVYVILNKKIMDTDVDGLAAEDLLKHSKILSGRIAPGTLRPLQYILSVRDVNKDMYEGIYDLYLNQWLKLPNGIHK